jgi:hypothetical protein
MNEAFQPSEKLLEDIDAHNLDSSQHTARLRKALDRFSYASAVQAITDRDLLDIPLQLRNCYHYIGQSQENMCQIIIRFAERREVLLKRYLKEQEKFNQVVR